MSPLYDYTCENCGLIEDVIAKHDDKELIHDKCKGIMKRQLHCRYGINMGPVPTGGYFDENLGCHIETNRQREKIMAEQGVTEKGATPKINKHSWF